MPLLVLVSLAYVLVTILLSLHYWFRLKKTADAIPLAPLSVRGDLVSQIGTHELGLILRSQFTYIREAFGTKRPGQSTFYSGAALSESLYEIKIAFENAPLEAMLLSIEVHEEMVITIGHIRIPVGAMMNLFRQVIRRIPAPFKNRYLQSLIYVSLLSYGEETTVFVSRGKVPTLNSNVSNRQNQHAPGGEARTLQKTSKVKDLSVWYCCFEKLPSCC